MSIISMFVRSEVLAMVLRKIQVFWDVMAYQLVNSYGHFERS
jgi:hypothetical protein